MKKIFTFSAILFSLLLTNGSLAQSQESSTTEPPHNQLSTTGYSQRTEGIWIGLLSGTVGVLIGAGFGFVQFRKYQKLEQEKLSWQQNLDQEKLSWQQNLDQEKLAWQQNLDQEKLSWQQNLDQEKLSWEKEQVTWEAEKHQLQYELKLEQQKAELEKQQDEAEAEETAQSEAESEVIEETIFDEETDVYYKKVFADLRNQRILELNRQNLNQAE